MLKRFTVENFLSFGQEVSFTMEPGRVRGKRDHVSERRNCNLLRFSAIYGSNAAGKSNYIYAMRFAREAICHKMPKHTVNKYHRVSSDNKEKPTKFEFEIRLDKKQYRYTFSLNMNTATFLSESLTDCSTAKEKRIFERDIVAGRNDIAQISKNTSSNERIKAYLEDMEDDASILFLNYMNHNKTKAYELIPELHVFRDVYGWFQNKLRIIFPEEDSGGYSVEWFISRGSDVICELLGNFGLNITNTDFEEVPFEAIFSGFPTLPPAKLLEDVRNDMYQTLQEAKKKKGKHELTMKLRTDLFSVELDEEDNLITKRLQLVHGNNGRFNVSEESDGTRRLIELIDIFLNEEDDITFVIDEIDRSLHPLITKRFVELFLQTLKDQDRQLIVSTHESRLLDLSFLRKDEIWFMTKNEGVSTLERLDSQNVRPDLKIDVAYLKGKIVQIPKW